jgi:aminoacrylate hydrolase
MADVDVNGVSIHYELYGSGSPVMLITGLNGIGRAWGPQVELFASYHRVILPDHRGAGSSAMPPEGYTIEQHAADMVAVLRDANIERVDVVGISTGGAIAQVLALDYPDVVRTATMASSWAKADEFFRREFELRKKLVREIGLRGATESNALFLFSPEYVRDNPQRIAAWVEAGANARADLDIVCKRIDMVIAHDQTARLGQIRKPVLILNGARDFCTPGYHSQELARSIPGAELQMLEGGHFTHLEHPQEFFNAVQTFIARYE